MKYYELKFNVVLKKNIEYKDSVEELSKVINKSMILDDRLKEYHKMNCYKYYVYSNFYPAKNNNYIKGCSYFFRFRGMDRQFVLKMKEMIRYITNDLFDVISVTYNAVSQEQIEGLYTLTPTIATFSDNEKRKHWTRTDFSIEDIKTRINMNAIRKYNEWSNSKIDVNFDFIEEIEQINSKAMVFNYKDSGFLITNKFRIKVKQDKLSQDLAFMVLGAGILEKNSLGLGFCESGLRQV